MSCPIFSPYPARIRVPAPARTTGRSRALLAAGVAAAMCALPLASSHADDDIFRCNHVGSSGLPSPGDELEISLNGPRAEVREDLPSASVTMRYDMQFGMDFAVAPMTNNTLELRYRDNGPAARVIAALYHHDGAGRTNSILLFDSDNYQQSSSFQKRFVVSVEEYLHYDSEYWIELVMMKDAPGGAPAVEAVAATTQLAGDPEPDFMDYRAWITPSTGSIDEGDRRDLLVLGAPIRINQDSATARLRYPVHLHPRVRTLDAERIDLLISAIDSRDNAQVVAKLMRYDTTGGRVETLVTVDTDTFNLQRGDRYIPYYRSAIYPQGRTISAAEPLYVEVVLRKTDPAAKAAIEKIRVDFKGDFNLWPDDAHVVCLPGSVGQPDEGDYFQYHMKENRAGITRSLGRGAVRLKYHLPLDHDSTRRDRSRWIFQIDYVDSGNDANVVAELRRYDRVAGTEAVIATFDSDEHPQSDNRRDVKNVGIVVDSDAFDLDHRYAYYVAVKLSKSRRRGRAEVHSIAAYASE